MTAIDPHVAWLNQNCAMALGILCETMTATVATDAQRGLRSVDEILSDPGSEWIPDKEFTQPKPADATWAKQTVRLWNVEEDEWWLDISRSNSIRRSGAFRPALNLLTPNPLPPTERPCQFAGETPMEQGAVLMSYPVKATPLEMSLTTERLEQVCGVPRASGEDQ